MGSQITEQKVVTTNLTTGEQSEKSVETVTKFPKTPDFVMTFTKDLGYMKELSKGEMLVLFGLLKIVNNENEVILNKAIKERICNEFELKISSIDVIISGLKKKKVILAKEGERGIYQLQPSLFGKGKWTDIKKLRMVIEWDFKNMTKRTGLEAEYKSEEEIIDEQMRALEKERERLKAQNHRPVELNLHDKQTSIFDYN